MTLKIKKDFVVLCQGDSSANENKYTKLLASGGINAESIPTLTFNFVNRDNLQSCLHNVDRYSGIIFSSTRAVNAVSSALISSKDSCIEKWKNKMAFSVGKATAELAQSLLNLDTSGSDSGNSEKLCQFIIENCSQIDKPLLFPCSNIRKDTIPVTLSQKGFLVDEVVCYETIPNPQFENLWKNIISTEQGLPEVIVFFSPSGVDSCIETVRNSYSNGLPKFIALGPTTEKALLGANISCTVTEKPSPESVLCAVKNIQA